MASIRATMPRWDGSSQAVDVLGSGVERRVPLAWAGDCGGCKVWVRGWWFSDLSETESCAQVWARFGCPYTFFKWLQGILDTSFLCSEQGIWRTSSSTPASLSF